MTILTFIRSPYAIASLAAIAILGGLIWWATSAQDRAVTQARDAGSATQRAEQIEQSIHTIGRAKNAVEEIKRSPDAARAGCLRYSRTPENCQ